MTNTSCFFCQNLLSDFSDALLPASREQEIKGHLETCKTCRQVNDDLSFTSGVLRNLKPLHVGPEMGLRIAGAAQKGTTRFFSPARISRFVLLLAVPCLLFAGAVQVFPRLFPGFIRYGISVDEAQFVRYFPLIQGAGEILDEQANWLHVREPFMRSLWEEGGLSPEEFEKSFQAKPGAPSTTDSKEEAQ